MSRFVAQKPLTINATTVPAGAIVTTGQLHDRNIDVMLRRGEITYTTDATDSPAPAAQDSPTATETVSVSEMTVAQIEAGLSDGRLDPVDVRAAEMKRKKPRVTVLRALGDEV